MFNRFIGGLPRLKIDIVFFLCVLRLKAAFGGFLNQR